MKRYLLLLLTIALLALLFAGCSEEVDPTTESSTLPSQSVSTPGTSEPHTHQWVDATCTAPKTCADCGETEGEALDHDWKDATCSAPKTCTRCEATEGEALEHSWKDATCTSAKKCTVCGKKSGKALGHDWEPGDCENPGVCRRCGKTDSAAQGHSWVDATTEAPKTCTACGLTEGERIITDSRFHTADCKSVFGSWAGVAGKTECRIFFGNAGELIVEERTSQTEKTTTTGVYYVSGGDIYMAISWQDTMQTLSLHVNGDSLELVKDGSTVTLTKLDSFDAPYIDARFDKEAAKDLIGTWGMTATYGNITGSATCIFTADGYVYGFAATDDGSRAMSEMGRYYVKDGVAYGYYVWADEMKEMKYELVGGKLSIVFRGMTILLDRISDDATDPNATTDSRFDPTLCQKLLGSWEGEKNGKALTFLFGENGALTVHQQVKEGVVRELKYVYFVGGTQLYVGTNWFEAMSSGQYTISGDNLSFTIDGQSLALTRLD